MRIVVLVDKLLWELVSIGVDSTNQYSYEVDVATAVTLKMALDEGMLHKTF